MAYSPENNPYIPGDPYSYDLKWIVTEVKHAIELYTPLSADFTELREYVENYFANLDVSEEVSAKIDSMVQSGELDAIILPYFNAYKADIDNAIQNIEANVDAQNNNINVLQTRMDSFTQLAAGSTTGDAELIDARIAYDGIEFANAGDAIRGQAKEAFTGERQLGAIVQGTVDTQGNTVNHSKYIHFKSLISVRNGEIVRLTLGTNASRCIIRRFNSSMVFQADDYPTSDYIVPATGYLAIIFSRTDTSIDLTPSQFDAVVSLETREDNIIKAEKQLENPFEPVNFSALAYAKGAYAGAYVPFSAPVYTAKDLTAYNAASTGTQTTYSILSFLMGSKRIPELTSGQTIEDIYLMIKSNKNITIKPYLSQLFDWQPAAAVAAAPSVVIKAGYNLINPIFAFDHLSKYSVGNVYSYLVLRAEGKWNDLELEVTMVKGGALLANIMQSVPMTNTDILFWGDSLIAGAGGSGTTAPQVCANELGLSYINAGVGGENSNTIAARQGGNNVIIPAGAVNGTYTEFTDIFGGTVKPLIQGNGSGSASYIWINGQRCTITYNAGVYTIAGYTGTTAAESFGMFEGSNFASKIAVIWIGQNGSTVEGQSSLDARMSIIDSMIAHLPYKNYIVMGLSSGTESAMASDDRRMLAKYGNNYFPTRRLLVKNGLAINGMTPTAQDQADISAGAVPSSLIDSGVHLNAAGYTAVGKLLADKIRALGYV